MRSYKKVVMVIQIMERQYQMQIFLTIPCQTLVPVVIFIFHAYQSSKLSFPQYRWIFLAETKRASATIIIIKAHRILLV